MLSFLMTLFQRKRFKLDQKLVDRMKDKSFSHDIFKSFFSNPKVWAQKDDLGNKLIHHAARFNNAVIVRYLTIIKENNVNDRNSFGETALMVAIANDSVEAIEELLKAGASVYKPNFPGKGIAHWFLNEHFITRDIILTVLKKIATECKNNNELIADKLCSLECPLNHVLLLKNIKVTEIMLKRGYSVDARTKGKNTVLHKAVQLVDVNHVKLLLENNANPNLTNAFKRTPLYYLYDLNERHCDDHIEILKILIAHNADLSFDDGTTIWSQIEPILRFGNKKAIEILIRTNLDLNKTVDGIEKNLLIHILAENRNPGVFNALDNINFDANARNSKSQSLLHLAVFWGNNAHTVQYLIDRGADVDDAYGNDASPLHKIVQIFNKGKSIYSIYEECLQILLINGADFQLHNDTLDGLLKMLEIERVIISEDARKTFIARLIVNESREINIVISRILVERPSFKSYYNLCQQLLITDVYKSITLADFLSASEFKFEQYLRNQELKLKLQHFSENQDASFRYLNVILRRRICKVLRIIQLRKDAAYVLGNILKAGYVSHHLIIDNTINFLSEQDLRKLLIVPLFS